MPITVDPYIRADCAIQTICKEYSRAQIQKWLKNGNIYIDEQIKKYNEKLHGGEVIRFKVYETDTDVIGPENIPINIAYEDSDVMIINKPSNLVVHPGAGNNTGT